MVGGENKSSTERSELRVELDQLESAIAELKVQYEQYFSGILALAPDKFHADVKRRLRNLLSAPFRSSEINFRLRTLKSRYQSFDTYFQRVMKQREEGTYARDVFKANLRDQIVQEEQSAHTAQGAASKSMRSLFDSYCEALENHTGRRHELDFKIFQKSLIKRARELREKHGIKKLTFKVVVKDGKVSVQAKARDSKQK